jgi:hypothetical protein
MPEELKPLEGQIPQTAEELDAQIKAELDKSTEPDKLIEIKLSTGEVYKGKTEAEVIEALKKGKEEATVTIRDRERQIKELREKDAPLTPAKGEVFDKTKYYELMSEDPMGAFHYQMAYVMGVDPAHAGEALRYAYQTAQAVDARLQNALFREKYPSAPYGDDFADTMMNHMTDSRRAWTAENLGMTYLELKEEGKVKESKQDAPVPAEGDAPPPNPGKSSSGVSSDTMSQIEKMSTNDLEAYLKKLGVL